LSTAATIAVTVEQTTAAAAAVVTAAATTIATTVATAATMATVTGDGHILLTADEGDADHREENRDAKN
jgi:hypothetical protein